MHNRTHESRRSQNNTDKRNQRGRGASVNERDTHHSNQRNDQREFSPRNFRDLGDSDTPFLRENDFNDRTYGNSPRFNEYDRGFDRGDVGYRRSMDMSRNNGVSGYQRDSGAYDPWGESEGWQSYRGGYETPGVQTRYFGKGPKGYKRSDERIREDVNDLLSEGYLDASDVEVQVQDGEVTLSGTVPTRAMKLMAEQLAERANGVTEVMNQLRVKAGAVESTDENGRSVRTSTRPRHN